MPRDAIVAGSTRIEHRMVEFAKDLVCLLRIVKSFPDPLEYLLRFLRHLSSLQSTFSHDLTYFLPLSPS